MNIKNIRLLLVTVVIATVMGSCHIYKKYDLPDDSTQSAKYKEALEQPVDSSALGNLQWDEIFTDPQLQMSTRRRRTAFGTVPILCYGYFLCLRCVCIATPWRIRLVVYGARLESVLV